MKMAVRVLVVLLAVALSARLLLCIVLFGFSLVVHGDVTYPEGALVHAVRRVAAGQPLYSDFRSPPHFTVVYGPSFFFVAGIADRFLGEGPFGSYVVARTVALTAFALLVGLCGWWSAEMTGSRRHGAMIAALAAASPAFWRVSVSARVDSLALLASIAGLWLASRRWGGWRWVLVWLLALAAWSCKQNALAIGPAVAVWLFQTRGIRAAAAWSAAWIGGLAGLWSALHYGTDGLFTLNAITAIGRAVDWPTGMRIVRDSAPHVALVLAFALWHWPRAIATESLRLTAWWFAFALILSVAPIFGEGGGINHLLEAWLAACLLVGPMLSLPPWRCWLLVSALSVVVVNDAAYFFGHDVVQISQAHREPPQLRQTGGMPQLLPMVVSCPGEVFVQYPYLAVVSQRPPELLDTLHYRQMVDRGLVRGELLANRFAARRYRLVVLREALGPEYDETQLMRWPRQVWTAIQENYQLAMVVDGQYVYVPITPEPHGSERSPSIR